MNRKQKVELCRKALAGFEEFVCVDYSDGVVVHLKLLEYKEGGLGMLVSALNIIQNIPVITKAVDVVCELDTYNYPDDIHLWFPFK